MRYLFGFMCVLALSVMGCSETSGEGGTGGDGGAGRGMPECQSPGDCDDDNECTDDTCLAGVCEFMAVPDPTGPDEPGDPPGEGTTCGYYLGTCEAGSCAGTFACTEAGIREAIAAGAGPHTFGCDGPTTVVTEAEIVIDNDVVLDGEGNLTVDGDDDHRVFSVTEEVTVELEGFAVTGGDVAQGIWDDCEFSRCYGGGIFNLNGTLTLTNSTVSGNMAFEGGGINSHGTLTLTNSTVSGNTASQAGGIFMYGTPITLTNSTISENSAAACCGGMQILGGTTTLTNSTVSGNTAGTEIGGIANFHSTLTLTNSTVSGNSAPKTGGIHSAGSEKGSVFATLTLMNSTVSGNNQEEGNDILYYPSLSTFTAANSVIAGACNTAVSSNGYNIESPGNTCGFNQGTDQFDVSADDLKLGELGDNGGPTMTHALEAGSVAIDVIPEDDCVDAEGELLWTDQRGAPRFVGPPFGPVEPVGDGCDVGAFELQPPPAESCTQSGGTVSTGLCCQAVESFPNTCAIGACGCAPDASHEVAVCICPTNTCFDGESCVAQ